MGIFRHKPTLVRRSDGFALACAACGKDAITFRVEADGVHGSLFHLGTGDYGTPLWTEEAGQHIARLLTEDKSRELVRYIESLNPGQWEVHCPACDRIYCQEHHAAETVWSGTWAVGMRVTCPKGHRRSID